MALTTQIGAVEKHNARNRAAWLKWVLLIGVLLMVASIAISWKAKRNAKADLPTLSQSVPGFPPQSNSRRDKGSSQARNQVALMSAFGAPVIKHEIAWLQDYRGELLVTHDRGKTWSSIGGDVAKQFDQFTMLDSYHGWAADTDGRIWKTDDAGYSWHATGRLQRSDPQEYYKGALQILFTDERNGWVFDTFAVWRTTDGGFAWQEVKQLERPTDSVRAIQFLDSRVGWAVCEEDLLKTEDGGNSWRSLRERTCLDNLTTIRTLSFQDENHGWIAASDAPKPHPENVVLYTEDGGGTWHRPKGFDDKLVIYCIFFLDDKMGWAAGGSTETSLQSKVGKGVLFQTRDGGRTWQRIEWAPTGDIIKSLHFTSADEGWLASDYDLYRTHDSGRTWSRVLSYPEIKDRNIRVYGFEQSSDQSVSEKAATKK